MTIKTFKKKLGKIIDKSDEFITYDNRDVYFGRLDDEDLIVVGEDESETFVLKIIKVE